MSHSTAEIVAEIAVRTLAALAIPFSLLQIFLSWLRGHSDNLLMWSILLIVWVGLLLLRRWAAILFCGLVGFRVLCDLYGVVDMAMSHTPASSEALLVGVEGIALAVSAGVLHFLGPRLHPGL